MDAESIGDLDNKLTRLIAEEQAFLAVGDTQGFYRKQAEIRQLQEEIRRRRQEAAGGGRK